MKKEIKSELYSSPEVKVIEVKARQVICQSVSSDGQLGSSGWEEGIWE